MIRNNFIISFRDLISIAFFALLTYAPSIVWWVKLGHVEGPISTKQEMEVFKLFNMCPLARKMMINNN